MRRDRGTGSSRAVVATNAGHTCQTQKRETTQGALARFGPRSPLERPPAPPPAAPQRAAKRPGRAERGHPRAGTRRRLRRRPPQAAGAPAPGPRGLSNSAVASATTTGGWGARRPRRPPWPLRRVIKANRPVPCVRPNQGAPPRPARAQPWRTL